MSKEPYPSETAERFIVRFPDGMRDKIREAAEQNNRSMNAEIIARLEASFQVANPPLSAERLVDMLTEQQRLIVDLQNISKAQSKQIDRLLETSGKDHD